MSRRGHRVRINLFQRGALTGRKCICLANSKDQEREASKCWTVETGPQQSPKPKCWESCVRRAKTPHPPHAACQQEREDPGTRSTRKTGYTVPQHPSDLPVLEDRQLDPQPMVRSQHLLLKDLNRLNKTRLQQLPLGGS